MEIKNKIDEAIKNLSAFNIDLHGKSLTISYQMLFTMIDGKVLQAVTETASSQTCPLCKDKPSSFSNFEAQRALNEDALQFGISPLHAKIRFMEHILHISYDLSFGPAGETVRNNAANKKKREDGEKKGFNKNFVLN